MWIKGFAKTFVLEKIQFAAFLANDVLEGKLTVFQPRSY